MAQVVFLADVDEKLAEQLPRYMVPDVYFAVTQLPMLTSGNTDRRRLREMGTAFSTQQQGLKQQPSTEAGMLLCVKFFRKQNSSKHNDFVHTYEKRRVGPENLHSMPDGRIDVLGKAILLLDCYHQ
jgi:hypothetical protein